MEFAATPNSCNLKFPDQIGRTILKFYIHLRPSTGTIAQVVEQWIENPCVPGSNPGGTTINRRT